MLLINGQTLPSDLQIDIQGWANIASVMTGMSSLRDEDVPQTVLNSLRALPSGFVTPFEQKELNVVDFHSSSRQLFAALSLALRDQLTDPVVNRESIAGLYDGFVDLRENLEREGDIATLRHAYGETYRLLKTYWQVLHGGDSHAASLKLQEVRLAFGEVNKAYEGPPDPNAWYLDQGSVGFVTENGKAGSANVKDCIFGSVTGASGKRGVFHFDSLDLPGSREARTDAKTLLRHLDTLAPDGSDTPLRVSLAGANINPYDAHLSDKAVSKLAYLLDLLHQSPTTYDLATLDVLKQMGELPTAIISDKHGLHQGMAVRGEAQGRLHNQLNTIQLGQQLEGNIQPVPYRVAFDLEKHPGLMAGVLMPKEAGYVSAFSAARNEAQLVDALAFSGSMLELMVNMSAFRAVEKANVAATAPLIHDFEKELLQRTGQIVADKAGLIANMRGIPKFIGENAHALNEPLEKYLPVAAMEGKLASLFPLMERVVGDDPLSYTAENMPNSTGPNRPPSSRKK